MERNKLKFHNHHFISLAVVGFVLLISSSLVNKLSAQTFEKYYGAQSTDESFNSGVELSNGDQLLWGYKHSNAVGGSDFYLVKVNAQGNLISEKTIENGGFDEGTFITKLQNGTFLLQGNTQNIFNEFTPFTAILDQNGNLIWKGSSSNLTSKDHQFIQAIETSDGKIFLQYNKKKGQNSFDVYLLILDSSGNELDNQIVDSNSSVINLLKSDTGKIYSFGIYSSLGGQNEVSVIELSNSGSPIFIKTLQAGISEVVTDGQMYYYFSGYTFYVLDEKFDIKKEFENIGSFYRFKGLLSNGELLMAEDYLGGVASYSVSTGDYNWSGLDKFSCNFLLKNNSGKNILIGHTNSKGGFDAIRYQVLNDGSIENEKTFGIVGPEGNENGNKVEATKDNGYIFLNNSNDQNISEITKIDSIGNIKWTTVLSTSPSSYSISLNDLIVEPNGEVFLVGYSGGDTSGILMYKLSSEGNILFHKNYGVGFLEQFNAFERTQDGFIIVGIKTTNTLKGFIMKIDLNGDTIWTKIIPSLKSGRLRAVVTAENGDIIVAGTKRLDNLNQGNSCWALRLSTDGEVKWDKNYSIYSNESSSIHSIEINPDTKQIYFSGYIKDLDKNDYFSGLILKCSESGELSDYIIFNDLANENELVYNCEYKNNELTCFGSNGDFDQGKSKPVISKFDNNLKPLWQKKYLSDNGILRDGHVLKNLNLIAIGTGFNFNSYDAYLIKTNQDGSESTIIVKPLDFDFSIAPNLVANNNVNVTVKSESVKTFNLQILDTNGNILRSIKSIQSSTPVTINVDNYQIGSYFVRIIDNHSRFVTKIFIKQ